MTEIWDETMSDQSAKELLELLDSRWKLYPQDNTYTIELFRSVVAGEKGDHYDPNDLDHKIIETCFRKVLELIAPPETTLKESFWQTNAGQLLANIEFWLYGEEAISVADTARMIYGDAGNSNIAATLRLIERNRLLQVHRPVIMMLSRRKTTKTGDGTNRSRLVRKDSLNAYLAERQEVK